MVVTFTSFDNREHSVILNEEIGHGSNSFVYEAIYEDNNRVVAKCSKNANNYVSFNLQCNAYLKCFEIFKDTNIVIPKVFAYGFSPDIGDVLVIEEIEHLYPIEFMINQSLYYGDVIIMSIAYAVSMLHNNNISGYDVEFFWKADTNQLVLLDIGPIGTFNCSSEEMLTQHLKYEANNLMGYWNIVSQIVPTEMAKDTFKNNNFTEISSDILLRYLDRESVNKHIECVAKIHALVTLGQLHKTNRKKYLKIFINKYKKNANITWHSMKYLQTLEDAINFEIERATAQLYYSNCEVLSIESCSIKTIWK